MKKKVTIMSLIALTGLGVWLTGKCFFLHKNEENIDTSKGYERLIQLEEPHEGTERLKVTREKTTIEKDSIPKEKKQYKRWKKHPLSVAEAKKAFANSVILGDSMVEAIDDYGLLYASEIVFSRGMSVGQADELFKQAIELEPENVFIIFGLNDLAYYQADADKFTKAYKKQVEKILDALPDCKIFINGITPVLTWAVTSENKLDKVDKYNRALKKMCQENGFTYVDTKPLIENQKKMYEPDGIHPVYAYYPKWFALMAEMAELDGKKK